MEEDKEAAKGIKFRMGDFFQHLIWLNSKFSDAHLLYLNIYCTIYILRYTADVSIWLELLFRQ